MNTAELKSNLHNLIDAVQDNKTLNVIYQFLSRSFKDKSIRKMDGWDKLTRQQQKEIDASIKSLENGEGIPHEKVMARYSKFL